MDLQGGAARKTRKVRKTRSKKTAHTSRKRSTKKMMSRKRSTKKTLSRKRRSSSDKQFFAKLKRLERQGRYAERQRMIEADLRRIGYI